MLTGSTDDAVVFQPRQSLSKRILRVEWLGQTAASLFWIASVFTYGITAVGDWLQLFAASAWLIANIASLLASESHEQIPPSAPLDNR